MATDTTLGNVDASQATGSAWAWAYCPGWRGSPELLAHIAQAAIHALRDEMPQLPTCRIHVRVKDDIERFNSPRSLRRDITTDALRRFDAIDMLITAATVKITVRLARKADEARPWLKRGLLVEVTDDSPTRRMSGNEDLVDHLVSDVLAAVRRGFSRDREIRCGNDRQRMTAEEDYHQRRVVRGRRWRLVTVFTALVAILYVAYLRVLGTGSAPGEGSDSLLTVVVPTAIGGAMGAVPVAFLLWVRPDVEVSEVTRAQQITRTTLKAVGPVIGGGLALAARLLG